MARCCQWPADSEAALKESAKTWPTDSTSEENECSLESWLVKNGTANRSIFERIFTKYNREYKEEEIGGKLVNFEDGAIFESQLQMLFETGKVECISSDESSDESSGVCTSDLGRRRRRKRCRSSNNDVAKYHKKEESVDLLNSAEEEEEDCASGSEPDPELTARIHQKLVEIKEEMNWDEQERMDRDATTLLVYSSSEEDLPVLKKATPGLATRLVEIEDGLLSGFSDHDYSACHSVCQQAHNSPLHTGHPLTSIQSITYKPDEYL